MRIFTQQWHTSGEILSNSYFISYFALTRLTNRCQCAEQKKRHICLYIMCKGLCYRKQCHSKWSARKPELLLRKSLLSRRRWSICPQPLLINIFLAQRIAARTRVPFTALAKFAITPARGCVTTALPSSSELACYCCWWVASARAQETSRVNGQIIICTRATVSERAQSQDRCARKQMERQKK
jgi:hypothetical protein